MNIDLGLSDDQYRIAADFIKQIWAEIVSAIDSFWLYIHNEWMLKNAAYKREAAMRARIRHSLSPSRMPPRRKKAWLLYRQRLE